MWDFFTFLIKALFSLQQSGLLFSCCSSRDSLRNARLYHFTEIKTHSPRCAF